MMPMNSRFSAAMFAILFLRFAPAYAQENTPVPDVVDLPAVLRLVRDASPRLSIERQAVAGAEANRITAGAYPNPTVSYGRFRPSGGQATLRMLADVREETNARFDGLSRQMRVLHEDVIERISRLGGR